MSIVNEVLRAHDDSDDFGQGRPDPLALEVVRTLQGQLPDAQVLLFGNRAEGHWNPWSDVDLAVIGTATNREAQSALQDQARAVAEAVYNPLGVDLQVFAFSQSEFEKFRTSRPHMAGQVQCRGLTGTGESLPPVVQDNPWPGVRNLLLLTHRHLTAAVTSLAANLEHCALALARALGAAMGAIGVDFTYTKDLKNLVADMPDTHRAWLEGMPTPAQLDELSLARFKGEWPETGLFIPDPQDPADVLVEMVQPLCGLLAGHALETLGKRPQDVGYEQGRYDIHGAPLGGVEFLPLNLHDVYAHTPDRDKDRIRQTHALYAAVAVRLEFLAELPLQTRFRLRDAWLEAGICPGTHDVVAVLTGEVEWHTLLPKAANEKGAPRPPLPL